MTAFLAGKLAREKNRRLGKAWFEKKRWKFVAKKEKKAERTCQNH